MSEFIEVISDKSIKEIDVLNQKLSSTVLNVEKISKSFGTIILPSDLKKSIREVAAETEKSNKLLKESQELNAKLLAELEKLKRARSNGNKPLSEEEKLQRKLKKSIQDKLNAQKKEAQQIIKNREATRKLNQENRSILSAYGKLTLSLRKAQENYRNLSVEFGENSRQAKKARVEANRLKNSVDLINNRLGIFNSNVGRYTSAFRGFLGAFGLTSGIFLFASAIRDAGRTIIEFDKQLIAVGKTTNLTGQDLQDFGQKSIELGLRLKGISIQGLLKTAEVAGQLGIKGSKDILKFSKTIEQLKLTSDLIGQEGARNFATFIEVSSDTVKNADRLGSVITELGNNYATTESQILSNATEIQKGISIYNTSAQGVLALGAATNALGNQAESSRSALQSTFAVIDKAISSGENLEQVLSLTGLTQEELSRQFRKDATGVFKLFIKGLNDADKAGGNLRNILESVNITEKRAVTVVGSLAKNYNTLETAVDRANTQYSENNALSDEAAASAESLSSKLNDISDSWDALVLSIENGQGGLSRTFKFLLDQVDTILSGFRRLALSDDQELLERFDTKKAESYAAAIKEINRIVNEEGITERQAAQEVFDANISRVSSVNSEIKALKKRREELEKQKENTSVFNSVQLNGVSRNLDKVNKEIETNTILLAFNEGQVSAAQQTLSDLNSEILKTTEETTEQSESISKSNTKREKQKTIISSLINLYTDLIEKERKVASSFDSTAEQTAKATDNIEKLKEKIDLLKKSVLNNIDDVSVDLSFDLPDSDALEKDFERIKNKVQPLTEEMKELQRVTEDFISSITSNFIQDSSLGSIGQFFDGTFDSLLEGANTLEERFAITFNAIGDVAQDVLGLINQRQQQRFDAELSRLDKEKEIALAFAGESAEARGAIEEDFEERKTKLKEQAAKREKDSAIFGAVINTAAAVVAALAEGGIPLAIAVGLLGAAEIALIASTPIPEFKDGVENFSGGLAKVNDAPGSRFKEIVRTPDGKMHRPQKRNAILNLPKGSDVFTADESLKFDKNLNSLLQDKGIIQSRNALGSNINIESSNGISREEMESIMTKTLSKIQTNNVNIDKNGIGVYAANAYGRTESLNNKSRFKGKKV